MAKKESSSLGAFTLVSYVPDPITRIIEELRESIPGNGFAQPHITVVPPRPLRVPLRDVTDFALPVLNRFSSFEVALGDVHCFAESNLLYLDVAQGENEINRLHDALNQHVLKHDERFEFRPHLTIGGPCEEAGLQDLRDTVRRTWMNHNRLKNFEVSEIAALWCDPSFAEPEWTRVWTHRLPPSDQTS